MSIQLTIYDIDLLIEVVEEYISEKTTIQECHNYLTGMITKLELERESLK